METKTYEETGRAKGKTFRLLLRALIEASEGKHVLFASRMNESLARYYFHRAMGICRADLPEETVKPSRTKGVPEIIFKNGGTITFTSTGYYNHDGFRGIKFHSTIEDD